MPADYKYFDNGEERTILSVLNHVHLTGVETTSGQFLVTVASTTGLHPGMAVNLPHIPAGAFIHAIHSATVIEIWASAWDATNGIFTTSGANAAATTTDTTGNLRGTAQGFDPRCLVTQTYARGTWRNTVRAPGFQATNWIPADGQLPFTTEPAYTVGGGGALTLTALTTRVSDELKPTPLKRHNGEPWSFFILVSTGGFQSLVPALPGRELIYSGVSA